MLAQRKERETGSGLMDIKFTNRLSYKQARLTVLVGFILGTLLSLIQIGIDYASEDASINREVNALLQISHNPASRIAYNIDSELALELTRGLLQSPAVIRARLIDNNETVLADVERPKLQDRSRPLSDFLFGEQRQFKERLYLTQMPEQYLGTLYLDIDTFAFGSRFLERAGITLLNGFGPQPSAHRPPAGAVLHDADQAAGDGDWRTQRQRPAQTPANAPGMPTRT